jgi:hypothetical protein
MKDGNRRTALVTLARNTRRLCARNKRKQSPEILPKTTQQQSPFNESLDF